MSEVYFSNDNLLIRSMEVDDAKIIYNTYLSYGWHPSLETYEVTLRCFHREAITLDFL